MWKKDFDHIATRAVFFVAQFIIVVVCVVYVDYFYLTNILPDKKAIGSYLKTPCFVMSRKLSSKNHLFHKVRSDFLISYNVSGVQYIRWVSGNGLDTSYTRNVGEQGEILAQYDTGKTYTCWYDPANPQSALLVPRHNWLSTYPIMLPAVVFIISIYCMIRNLLRLLSAVSITGRKITVKRKINF